MAGHSAAEGVLLGGRYRLERRLGSGGMADVWSAMDELLRRRVAVKLFREGVADSERAVSEIRLLAGLTHPGLVRVYDAVVASADVDRSYLVMELIDGPTLAQRLDSGRRLAPTEIADLGRQLAEALAYVHATGVVHRDLKPANVLLRLNEGDGPSGAVATLADFGVARLTSAARLTETGTTVGTANYVSPEQITGVEVGAPSDVYSLGLVLLECLTGLVEYPGHGVPAAVSRLHRAPRIPSWLDAGWVALLTAMLDRQPERRPVAATVAGSLRALATDESSDVTAVIPWTHGPDTEPNGTKVLAQHRQPRRRAAWLLPVSAAAVVVLAAGGVLIAQSGGSDAPASVPGSSTSAPSGGAQAVPGSSTPAPSRTATPTSTPTTAPTQVATRSTPAATLPTPQPPAAPGNPGKPGKVDKGKGKPPKK